MRDTYLYSMRNQQILRATCNDDLKEEFRKACFANDVSEAEVLRTLAKSYIKRQKIGKRKNLL